VIFLNPDTTAHGEPVSSIIEAFRRHPHVVAVAPRLLDWPPPGDEVQARFQLRRLPRLASDLRELLLVDRLAPGNRWIRRDRYLDHDRAAAFEVEQAAAAALAVRRRTFELVGGFDEQFAPAWFEDVDLCLRLHALGSILYWPPAEFYHRGGAAAATLGREAFLQMYHRNALRYRLKHYGRASYAAYRLALAAGMAGRALAAPLVERGHVRASMRAYLSVILLDVRRRR
jgi:GT2 family glycosyltransferase